MANVNSDQQDRMKRALGRKLTLKAPELRQAATTLRADPAMAFLDPKDVKALEKLCNQLEVVAKHFVTIGREKLK